MIIKKASEKTLEKKLTAGAKRLKGIALKFHCLSFTGFPDRIVLIPMGRLYLVELKSEGKKPSPRQKIVHEFLAKLGFPVYVIDSEETLKNFLIICAN